MQASAKPPALLIVDMQVGLFHGPERPYEGQRVLANIQGLIAKARALAVPIYAARHTGPVGSPIAAGSPFWQLMPELGLDEGVDKLFNKQRPNCFSGTGLADSLRESGIEEIVVVGMKTQYCIDTTCRAGADLGFRVTLASDAHTCMDTTELPAERIIAHHNSTLAGPFARVLSVTDVFYPVAEI